MFERLRVTSGQPRPSRLRQELANLYPGYFALVMATGIVSAGLIRAWPAASAMLLAVALAGFAVLTLLFGVRAALFPTRFVADLSSADRVFGFFTIVAAADVLALRADQQRWPQVSIGFAIVGAVTWALLTYAVPVLLVTRARHDSVNRTADGSWLLWVVATQSVAAVSAALAGEGRWWGALADGAVILWSVGTVLYLVLVTVVGAQLLVEGLRPGEFTPPFWILMGAAAISVLAGALISRLPGPDPMVSMALPLVSGMSLVLWAFASWWIPLLIVLQLWRCAGRGRRLSLETPTSKGADSMTGA